MGVDTFDTKFFGSFNDCAVQWLTFRTTVYLFYGAIVSNSIKTQTDKETSGQTAAIEFGAF